MSDDKRKAHGYYPNKRWYDDQCRDEKPSNPLWLIFWAFVVLSIGSIAGGYFTGWMTWGPAILQSVGSAVALFWGIKGIEAQ